MKKLTVRIASSVGGGPMQRLADRLRSPRVDASVVSGLSPERWRELLGAGRLGRLRARLETFLAYPLQAVADAVAGDSEVVVPTTNPFFLPWLMVATRKLHGRTVVPLLYDLYPDAVEAAGLARPDSVASRVAAGINRWMVRRADGVVFIGRRMADQVIARYGEPRRWEVIETGADVAEFSSERLGGSKAETELERWCDGHMVVAYVGAMGHMHDWQTLADAVVQLFASPPPSRKPVGVVVAATGPGVDRLRAAWKDLPPEHVRFEDPLDDRAWARLLARSDVSVATLKPAAHRTSMPSKAQSAIAAGSALLAIAPADSDLGELVETHGVGVRVDPGDSAGCAEALRSLSADPPGLRDLRRRAAMTARQHYDMPRLAARWQRFLDQVRAARSAERRPSVAKRAFDLAAASAGLAVVWPVLLGSAAAVRASMGSPVLFRQQRPGLRGETFELMKFRTMRDPRPGEEGPEHDADRITRVGAFLRATSLDELPTLLNVLRGDMSLVGPRPLLVRYLPRYSPEQARRHDVRPGVTGWAQIHGRNAISWEDKFRLDVWYVDNRTFWRDLLILARTVAKVFVREGISSEGHATMPEFMGSPAPAERAAADIIDLSELRTGEGSE